jgi:hypothetical protein
MVFLVPNLIEEADARTKVLVQSSAAHFLNIDVHMKKGDFLVQTQLSSTI